MKDEYVFLILGLLVLSAGFASTGWFSDTWNTITGNAVVTYCTSFTYSEWSACVNNQQTRTLISQSPQGCTIYVKRPPILTQTCSVTSYCTSFTYTDWSACVNNQQTRTIVSQTPPGCSGGNPILTQPCSVTSYCTSFTYSNWSTCVNNQQTRTLISQSPSRCSIGDLIPVLNQSCVNLSCIGSACETNITVNMSANFSAINYSVANYMNLTSYDSSVGFNGFVENSVDEYSSFNEEMVEGGELFSNVNGSSTRYVGYIVQLESEPIIVEKNRLETVAKNNERSTLNQIPLINNIYGAIATMPEEVPQKMNEYEQDIENEREMVKQRIASNFQGSGITGNVIMNFNDQGFFVKSLNWLRGFGFTGMAVSDLESESNIIIKNDYEHVFNGFSIEATEEEAKKIEKISGVKSVTPNYMMYADVVSSVPFMQDGVSAAKLDREGNNCLVSGKPCLTGDGVKIAIIDTGVDYTHPDLGGCLGANCKVIGGWSFIDCLGWNDSEYTTCAIPVVPNANPMDDHGHGTHCSAVASGIDSVYTGVAPGAKILAYKVLTKDGWGLSEWIIGGIERAVVDGADVLSISIGGGGNPDSPMSQAVDNAVLAGKVVAVSAGNSGPVDRSIGNPGTARKAITVGAGCKPGDPSSYCWLNSIAIFSSLGPVFWGEGEDKQFLIKPDIVAPGVRIEAAVPPALYYDHRLRTKMSGTSMAAPHIAGVVALMKQKNPSWTPEQIKDSLKATANDYGYLQTDQGAGFVNVSNFIKLNSPLTYIPKPFFYFNLLNPLDSDIFSMDSNELIEFSAIVQPYDSFSMKYKKEGDSSWRTDGISLVDFPISGEGEVIARLNPSVINSAGKYIFNFSFIYGGKTFYEDISLYFYSEQNVGISSCEELQNIGSESGPAYTLFNYHLTQDIDCSQTKNWGCYNVSAQNVNHPSLDSSVGICSSVKFRCMAGTLSSINTNSTHYIWTCVGTISNASCSSTRVGAEDRDDDEGDNPVSTINITICPGFSPISTINNTKYTAMGLFDGRGFEVNNLYMNRFTPDANGKGGSESYVGLFRTLNHISIKQKVVNLGLVNVNISSVGGSEYIGGIVGQNLGGVISNSHVTGNLGCSPMEYENDLSSPMGASTVGGLVGSNEGGVISDGGIINNSYFIGNVCGYGYVGGVVGSSLLGPGRDLAEVSISSVHLINPKINYKKITIRNMPIIENSYVMGNVTGLQFIGGLIGSNRASNILNSRFEGNIRIKSYESAMGWAQMVGGLVGTSSGGDILNSSGIVSLSPFCTNCSNYLRIDDVGGLVGYLKNYKYLGGYRGSFFPSLIDRSYSVGNISDGGSKNFTTYFGGLVGVVDDEGDYGTIFINNSYASVDINGGMFAIGGLVGYNLGGNIYNSYSRGNMLVRSLLCVGSIDYWCLANSPIIHFGGLVGYSALGKIVNSYSTGSVRYSDAPSPTDKGFVGKYSEMEFSGNFWDKETSGQTSSAGAVGKITAEMKNVQTFLSAVWDFENIWKIENSYPFHSISQIVSPPVSCQPLILEINSSELKCFADNLLHLVNYTTGYDSHNCGSYQNQTTSVSSVTNTSCVYTEPTENPVYITNTGNGGGGGGSGSGNTNTLVNNCTPQWVCTFGSCVDGKKIEACRDIYNCGNSSNKPEERTLDCNDALPFNNAEMGDKDNGSLSWIVIVLLILAVLIVLAVIFFILYKRRVFARAPQSGVVTKINDLLQNSKLALDNNDLIKSRHLYEEAKSLYENNHFTDKYLYNKFVEVQKKFSKKS